MEENCALVTGASSGLGRDIARALAKRGWRVILCARRLDRLGELARELGDQAEVYACDLNDPAAREALLAHCEGRVNMLVNNAGMGSFGRIWEADAQKEQQMLQINVEAAHHLMKLFLPGFVKEGRGHVLNICSCAAFAPGPGMAAYYASKAFLLRLSQAASEELRAAKSAVRVSAFCPGPIHTEFDQVAQVRFNVPYLSSQRAAQSAVDAALRGASVYTPGLLFKLYRVLAHLLPDSWVARLAQAFQRRG